MATQSILAPALSAMVIAIAVYLAVAQRTPVAVAVIPTAAATLVFGLIGVHPKNLRRLGWSLVASNILVLAALIVGLN